MQSRDICLTAIGAALCVCVGLSNATDQAELTVESVLAVQGDADFGEYLASECLTCHTAVGADSNIPVIHSKDSAYFVKALIEYKDGIRSSDTMRSVTGALGKEEMSALAAYFSSQ